MDFLPGSGGLKETDGFLAKGLLPLWSAFPAASRPGCFPFPPIGLCAIPEQVLFQVSQGRSLMETVAGTGQEHILPPACPSFPGQLLQVCHCLLA